MHYRQFHEWQYKYNDPWNESETAFDLEFTDKDNAITGKGIDSQRGEYVINGKYSTSNKRISFTKDCKTAENFKSWEVRVEWDEEENLFKGTEKVTVKVGCFNNATVYDCTIKYVN